MPRYPLPAPFSLQAEVVSYNVHLSWDAPQNDAFLFMLLGYNIYREGLRLNADPVPDLFYDDLVDLPGEYNF